MVCMDWEAPGGPPAPFPPAADVVVLPGPPPGLDPLWPWGAPAEPQGPAEQVPWWAPRGYLVPRAAGDRLPVWVWAGSMRPLGQLCVPLHRVYITRWGRNYDEPNRAILDWVDDDASCPRVC